MPQPYSSREDIKGDPLQEWTREFLEWIAGHRQTFFSIVGTAAVIIVVAILVIAGFTNLRKQAWEKYTAGQTQLMYGGSADNAINAFNDVIQNYSRTPAATYSLLGKGDILFSQKKYPEAIDSYKKALEKNPPKTLQPLILSGLGAAQEDSADYAGAIETYKKFTIDFPDHFLTPKIYESLARAYELSNNLGGAKETYEKIITTFSGQIWADRARLRYQALNPQPFQNSTLPASSQQSANPTEPPVQTH